MTPIREKLEAQLLQHEGFHAVAYADSLGFLTIGIGRMIDARKGGGITRNEALYLLGNDIDRIEAALDADVPWWRHLDDVRQRVLVDMAFNLGVSGLLDFANALGAAARGDFNTAAIEMLDSTWAGQVGLRAVNLATMMRTGTDAINA